MAPRPDAPRIEPVVEPDGELAEILSAALTHEGRPLNIFGVLGQHPKLLKRFNLLGGFLLYKGLLPEREREIVILRIGWNAQAEYEFGQHTTIGRQTGLSDEEIARITEGPEAAGWSERERLLLRAADELVEDAFLSDETWRALAAHYDTRQLLDLVFTVGQYNLVSMALNSFGVQLDPGTEGFPERG